MRCHVILQVKRKNIQVWLISDVVEKLTLKIEGNATDENKAEKLFKMEKFNVKISGDMHIKQETAPD
jgi:hypothetical protein